MKSPRHYFEEYKEAKTREDERKALKGLPKEWQGMIRTYDKMAKEREKHGC